MIPETGQNAYREYFDSGASRFVEYYRRFVPVASNDHRILAEELGNITQVINWCHLHGLWQEIIELVDNLDSFLNVSGRWNQAIQFDQLAIQASHVLRVEHPNDISNNLALIRFLCSMAAMLAFQSRHQEAGELLDSAMSTSQELDDKNAIALVAQLIGLLAERKGKEEKAEQLYHQALAGLHKTSYPQSVSSALEQLANMARRRSQYQNALNLLTEKLDLDKQTNNLEGMITILRQLGLIAGDIGDQKLAQECYEQASDLSQQVGTSDLLVQALKSRAENASNQRDYQIAYQCYMQALEIVRSQNQKPEIADLLRQTAFTAEELGLDTQEMLKESLSISQEIGDRPGTIRSLIQLGDIYLSRNDSSQAKALFTQALNLSQKISDEELEAVSWQQLGDLAQAEEDWDKAQHFYSRSLEISRKLNNLNVTALLLHQLGQAFYQKNQYGLSRETLQESIEINLRLGDWESAAGSLHLLAWDAVEEGDIDEALQRCNQSVTLLIEIQSPNLAIAEASLQEISHVENHDHR